MSIFVAVKQLCNLMITRRPKQVLQRNGQQHRHMKFKTKFLKFVFELQRQMCLEKVWGLAHGFHKSALKVWMQFTMSLLLVNTKISLSAAQLPNPKISPQVSVLYEIHITQVLMTWRNVPSYTYLYNRHGRVVKVKIIYANSHNSHTRRTTKQVHFELKWV